MDQSESKTGNADEQLVERLASEAFAQIVDNNDVSLEIVFAIGVLLAATAVDISGEATRSQSVGQLVEAFRRAPRANLNEPTQAPQAEEADPNA